MSSRFLAWVAWSRSFRFFPFFLSVAINTAAMNMLKYKPVTASLHILRIKELRGGMGWQFLRIWLYLIKRHSERPGHQWRGEHLFCSPLNSSSTWNDNNNTGLCINSLSSKHYSKNFTYFYLLSSHSQHSEVGAVVPYHRGAGGDTEAN